MAVVAQLVRASVCGTGGRGFESRQSPFLNFSIFFPTLLFKTYAYNKGIKHKLSP